MQLIYARTAVGTDGIKGGHMFYNFFLQNVLLQTILGCEGEVVLWNNINFCKNW